MICCQFVCGVISDELVAVKLCVIKLINDTILKYIKRLTEASVDWCLSSSAMVAVINTILSYTPLSLPRSSHFVNQLLLYAILRHCLTNR